jgi:hypothetical protein
MDDEARLAAFYRQLNNRRDAQREMIHAVLDAVDDVVDVVMDYLMDYHVVSVMNAGVCTSVISEPNSLHPQKAFNHSNQPFTCSETLWKSLRWMRTSSTLRLVLLVV